jgi:hypothetical protein
MLVDEPPRRGGLAKELLDEARDRCCLGAPRTTDGDEDAHGDYELETRTETLRGRALGTSGRKAGVTPMPRWPHDWTE